MFKIIADSSAEANASFLEKYPVDIVPFRLNLEGVEYVDDTTLDVDAFVSAMKASAELPKSACPSPNDFLDHIEGDEEEVYIVTISSKLSGTYNSAVMAKNIYDAEHPNKKKIHVIDSLGAAAGETLIVKELHKLKAEGCTFEQTVEKITAFTKNMQVYFISESLNNLIKNGRISKWKGLLAMTLSIHPIMGSDGEGEIKLFEKVRNANKAYQRLIEMIKDKLVSEGKKNLVITHVGNEKRAAQIKEAIAAIPALEDIVVLKCAGLSSLYADDKGIIVAF